MDYPNFLTIALLITLLGAVLAENSTEDTNALESLNEQTCSKKRSGCCSEMTLGEHPNLLKCMTMYASKMEEIDEKNPESVIKFFSCLIECYFKKSKYIGKGDTLNMKMVKMDAEHVFADRPKEKEYYIKAYDECNKRIIREFGIIKNSPAFKVVFKNSCRPIFTLMFVCHADYHTKHACPYFRWEDSGKDEHSCKDAKQKCYEIDGLEMPESIFD